MARPRQLSLEADKASGVCKTCCQTLSKLAICSVLIHPNPPLSRVINAYLNPLKAADEPWHCAGRVDAALYCTVLYCIVLYCAGRGDAGGSRLLQQGPAVVSLAPRQPLLSRPQAVVLTAVILTAAILL